MSCVSVWIQALQENICVWPCFLNQLEPTEEIKSKTLMKKEASPCGKVLNVEDSCWPPSRCQVPLLIDRMGRVGRGKPASLAVWKASVILCWWNKSGITLIIFSIQFAVFITKSFVTRKHCLTKPDIPFPIGFSTSREEESKETRKPSLPF